MNQGSALSPWLFVIVMAALSREFTVALRWEMLYADDLVVIAETEKDLIKRLNEWKDNVENRGMNRTWVMISEEWQKVTQKAVIWPRVLVVGSGYTADVVAQWVACTVMKTFVEVA